jgi:hypothetical protein
MAYRTFIDSDGVEWHAWDVLPRAFDRRLNNRRTPRQVAVMTERRRTERRQSNLRWTPLTSGLRDGWLCFDAEGNRRRLTPIPGDWEYCGERLLERYCRSASPARFSSASDRRG